MKKVIVGAVLAAVAFAAWMLWPRPLGEAFDTSEHTASSVTVFGITDGNPDNQVEEYEMEAGSDKGRRIGELLARHTYHWTLGSLTGDDTIEDLTMAIHLFNGKGQQLTLAGGTAELNLNHRIYRLDYWGADRGTKLCEEVLAILREE